MYSVFTKNAPAPSGPYSQGSSAARNVYVSGQYPLMSDSKTLVQGTISALTQQTINNIEAILTDVDLTLQDICQATLYVRDFATLPEIDKVWEANFEKPYPARTVVKVAELLYDSPLCIDAIALR